MACAGRLSFSLVHTGILLAIVLLPDFLGAIPVGRQEEAEVSSDVKAEAIGDLQTLVRNRRNLNLPMPFPMLSIPHLKRLPDFWGWYKYFMDTHNQEGIEDLDRLYMSWMQNNHKAEGLSSPYLAHLSEVYKTCANSDDPECISESTSKVKAAVVMPAPIKAATVRYCNPYIDPYCLYPLAPKAVPPPPPPPPPPAPEPEPEPEDRPVPIFTPFLPMPMKTATGYYYYAPVLESFLSAEQKTELLRICQPKDVECLQYHLRAAYGYRPAPGPAPSYSALTCDPKDPYCKPILVQKGQSGFYHVAAPAPLAAEDAPKEQHCNPLFDEGCNPLTATKLSSLTKPVLEYPIKVAPAPPAPPAEPAAPAPLFCDPRVNPFCILYAAAALRKPPPPPQLPEHQVRYNLGVAGKTKDGHDCFVHYDKDCTPVKAEGPKAPPKAAVKAPAPAAPAVPACHPFDFSCGGKPSAVEAPAKPAGTDGIIFPDDPHCDPEFDYNCRLRRAESAPAAADEPAADEPAAADEPVQYVRPRFDDFLRGYMHQSRH